MKVHKTPLAGVLIIEPNVYNDSRGFFLETYRRSNYMDVGVNLPFVQDNHSRSCHSVLRGLHYQLKHPQGKLISVTRGKIFDVVVDISLGSPTFGKSVCVTIGDHNHYRIYVPPGYAHGFCVVSEEVDLHYKCTDYYHPEDEYGICWNDPMLKIDWPVTTPIMSDKDKLYPHLADQAIEALPEYKEDNMLARNEEFIETVL